MHSHYSSQSETRRDSCKCANKDISIEEQLLKHRKLFISGEINSKLSHVITQRLLLLQADDSTKPITIFINSPGGEIYSGFAIYDMIQFIQPVVRTVVVGFAASMGSIISLSASNGNRFSLPNAMFMIHQPLLSGVYQGSVADIEIQAKEMINTKNRIIDVYVNATGKSYDEIKHDINRDHWLTANEALQYGPKKLIDNILSNISELD